MPKITISNANIAYVCEDDTLARAALREGLGFPYECNVGSCGNCRFELQSGEVVHLRANPPGLNERDIARNRYLGCQAQPKGDCTIKVNLRDNYKSHHLPRKTEAELAGIDDLTHDIREFRFNLKKSNLFLPGQYALLSLPDVEGARAYSMSNVTNLGDEWHFQIKRVPGGEATTNLFDKIKLGDTITIDGPYGMAYLREDAPRDILCLAGGSGLSPMISIARGAAASPVLQGRNIEFIYGGRSPKDICGEGILSTLEGYGSRIHYHPAISMPEGTEGWTGHTGFVHDIAEMLFGANLPNFEVYFAGPPAMSQAVMKMLITAKVPVGQLHFDQFY
ncbi:MAG: oxidoreductase [Rhizobiales bacterium 62-17]|nr:2Fe-2S iron-sulfur cluster binding domain-containing protein [Hyphomicrobiales bacterium]OJY00749.1 MAG: oxidoreductase [Rhizobiales bacterium 62-17]